MTPVVSIVMPVRNERAMVAAAMTRLSHDFPSYELVVVDGGSTDGTDELAARTARELTTTVRVATCAPGRARQMNRGAHLATGEVLWFVHVDTCVDPHAARSIGDALADPLVVGGGLRLRFDRDSVGLRYLAWTSNIRARRLHWIFGDQAMFVRRSAFDSVGGFPELPIMEDLELSRRLAQLGRLVVVPATSTASSRRFDDHGTWRMLVFMQWLKALYLAGMDPAEIARRYHAGPRRARSGPAPVPGPHPVSAAGLVAMAEVSRKEMVRVRGD